VLGALLAGVLALLAPAAAQASISVDDVSVSEGNGGIVATFTLTRDAGLLAGATSVGFATSDGSAHAPADYANTHGSIGFPGTLLPATQIQLVAVPIAGDHLDELNESFAFAIAGAEVAGGTATGTIVDDDPPPAVSVADAPPAAEGGSASFTVALTGPSGRDVSVAFATADASAMAGQDYTARSGTLTIPAGSTSAAIAVALTDDSADEPAETFGMRLSAPKSATLGDSAATATILDNDDPPAPGTSSPPGNATAPPPAPALPKIPVTGSSNPGTSGSVPHLGLGNPRLRPPHTGLVTLACPPDSGSCTGQVTLFTRPNKHSKIRALRKERRLGQRTFTLAGGRTLTLAFALGRADRGLLERAGRMKVRAYAVMRDGAGRSGVRTANGTLVRRTSHSSASARRSALSAREGLDEVGRALGAVVGRSPGL
jgi:hypothetical protein